MLLTITYTDRELERLMTRIPNFRPRGYGVFVFNKFEYTANDCDCRYCLHWHKGIGCTEGKCPYMKERITAGAVPIKEALLEALSTINHFAFQLRLRHHIRESEENTMQFKNDKHKEAFTEAVRKEGLVDSQTFMFHEIIGLKGASRDRKPHIWDDNGKAQWFGYEPTDSEFERIQGKVESYIEMYADQEMHYGGQMMGGM